MLFTYCFNVKSNAIKKKKKISFIFVGGIGHPKIYTFSKQTHRFLISKPLANFLFSVFFWDKAYFLKCNLYIYFLLFQLNAAFVAVFFTLCSM